jgi:putative ABC transport system permease protein
MGARPFDILRLMLRQGVTLVAMGVLAGLALTLALARILRRVLLMASATDPFAFIGVTLLLAAVALAACYIPARRAMRVDPMNALRHE